MARQLRLDLAGIAQHVVQRGNDRQPCFFTDADYGRYLSDLAMAAQRYEVAVHSYVLMTNHAHLLVTPTEGGAVARMMQCLGRHYVTYVNRSYRRSGTLWEGRYKSCLVDGPRYLLACHRYIELNPLRAAMVATPEAHRWSSYRANALGAADPLLSPHVVYRALADTDKGRRERYRALFEEVLDAAEIERIRAYLQQQRALGPSRFQRTIEAQLGRCATVRAAHRPPSQKAL